MITGSLLYFRNMAIASGDTLLSWPKIAKLMLRERFLICVCKIIYVLKY